MARAYDTPRSHRELLAVPPFARWRALAESNRQAAEGLSFEVGGVPATELRRRVREGALAAAAEFTRRLKIPADDPVAEPRLLVVGGHQPELYHAGVWVKDLLLQRFVRDTGAVGLHLVLDTDEAEAVSAPFPSVVAGRPSRSPLTLARGGAGRTYAATPVPTEAEVERFVAHAGRSLATLPDPRPARAFGRFADALRQTRPLAGDVGEFVTAARRRFEAPAGSRYLELPVSAMAASAAFRLFAADVLLRADRFAADHNGALAEYRSRTGARSAARPFPDLGRDGGLVEAPFWYLGERREAVHVRAGAATEVVVAGKTVAVLPAEGAGAADALAPLGGRLVPRAVTLTLFTRLFLADLFVHGVGGGRYDEATDAVADRFYGVTPPRYAVASLTLRLPFDFDETAPAALDEVRARLHRLRYNPDQMLAEAGLGAGDAARAAALAAEKRALTDAIAVEGADKKTLGARIRAVNEESARLLRPLEGRLRVEEEQLAARAEDAQVLGARDYPFCLHDPEQVMYLIAEEIASASEVL